MENQAALDIRPEEGEGDRANVRILAQELEKIFQKRCKFERMDAVDGGVSTSELNTTGADDVYGDITEAGDRSKLSSEDVNRLAEAVVCHKPPPYPPNGVNLTRSPEEDLFSACFEDAIGDNIVEDTELEWDHSPDTNITLEEEINEPVHTSRNLDISEAEMDTIVACSGEHVLPPPPPPEHPAPEVHDDVDGHPLPPPPPEIAFNHIPSLNDSGGGQSVIAYDMPCDVSQSEQDTCPLEPEVWPAPPLELELPPSGEAMASIEYKPVTSPVRKLSDVPEIASDVCEPATETLEDVRYKGYVSDSDDQTVKEVEAPQSKSETQKCSDQLERHNSDHLKREHDVAIDANVVVVEAVAVELRSKDKVGGIRKCKEASFATNESEPSLHDSIPVNNHTVVSIPINNTRAERNRHSFHPVPDHTPVLSSFGPATSSTLPRRSKSERTRWNGYENNERDGSQEEVAIPQTSQSDGKKYERISVQNNEINSTEASEDIKVDINGVRKVNTCPAFENSPLLKRHSNIAGAKRVLFQLPTTHRDSDAEDTSNYKETSPVSEKSANSSDSPNTAKETGRIDAETLSNDAQSSQGHSQGQASKPPPLRIPSSSVDQSPRDSPATRPKSLTKSSKRNSTRRTSPTDSQQSMTQSSTTSGSSQSLLRSPRVSQLIQKSHHQNPKHARRTTPGNGESDDSYFSDSDFDDDDYSDVQHLDDDGMSQTSDFTSYSDETMPRSPADRDRCYEAVLEMLKTERAYVDRLHFLCRVVLLNVRILNKVQDSFVIPSEALASIFNNVEDIFNLHTATILPKIEERVENWRTTPRLGDIMKEILPQLSIYTQYVEQFNNAMTSMTMWTERCPIFNRLVVEVEKTPECRRLKVKQHMLEIVQRVPKYLFLLKDYASHLAQDSVDKEDTQESLSNLTEFAQNLEQAMGKDGRMKLLKSVQQRLDSGSLKIYSPLRELVKEGKIKSISPKTTKKLDRYIFLMNDVLLICTTQTLAGKHKLKYSLEVDGLQVYDGDNLVIPFTFYVQNKTKAIEFHCTAQEEKNDWMTTIQGTIDAATEAKLMHQPLSRNSKSLKDDDVGKVKPKSVKQEGKPACTICRASMKKPNFCKGCGVVVCTKCSTQKVSLEYDSGRRSKVCDECYVLIIHRDLKTDNSDIPDVRPSDPCALAGYLQLNINKSQTWKKRWLTIHDNGLLYSFKNFKDQTVLGCLQLKRYSALATIKGDDIFKPNTLKLYNARRTYYLQADNTDAMSRWLDALAEYTGNRV